MDEQVISQIPFYSIQGVVQAVEIDDIIQTVDGVTIYPKDKEIDPFEVTQEYMKTSGAVPGGVFVRHPDGSCGYLSKAIYDALYKSKI